MIPSFLLRQIVAQAFFVALGYSIALRLHSAFVYLFSR